MQLNDSINFTVMPSVMSQEQFAVYVGKPLSTIKGWVSTNVIPTCKVGGSRLINFEQFKNDLLQGKDVFAKGDYDA